MESFFIEQRRREEQLKMDIERLADKVEQLQREVLLSEQSLKTIITASIFVQNKIFERLMSEVLLSSS